MPANDPLDVAEAIMRQLPGCSAKKIQKLTYYAHAIHRTRLNAPLVSGGFEAWRDGPVSQRVYNRQRGNFAPATVDGDPTQLDSEAAESVRLAIQFFGDRSEGALITLSHNDGPWSAARGDAPEHARTRSPIPDSAIDDMLGPKIRTLLEDAAAPRITLAQFKQQFALA